MLIAAKPKPYAYPRELRTIGDHLRKKRLDLGLFQRELADQLGVDEMTSVNGELNRTKPRPKSVRTIVGYLGYEPMFKQLRKSAAGHRVSAPHGFR